MSDMEVHTYTYIHYVVFLCFISCFTLTACEYEAVTADDGYKVHSPLNMKREQKQWKMGWLCETVMEGWVDSVCTRLQWCFVPT